jgi:hypothetical protein
MANGIPWKLALAVQHGSAEPERWWKLLPEWKQEVWPALA